MWKRKAEGARDKGQRGNSGRGAAKQPCLKKAYSITLLVTHTLQHMDMGTESNGGMDERIYRVMEGKEGKKGGRKEWRG